MRPGRRRRRDPRPHPVERPLRVGEPARRHLRAGRLSRLRAGRARRSAGAGRWDSLPAAHATAIALRPAGRARARARRAALRRRRASPPRSRSPGSRIRSRATRCNANTNDAIMPAVLVWGFWLASSPSARGAAVALAGWTKFAALLLAPLWLTYPDGPRRRGGWRGSRAAFGVATRSPFSVLLLEPGARRARCARSGIARSGSSSTATRRSRSGTGGSTTRAGSPTSRSLQTGRRRSRVVALAGVAAVVPREKGPLELAALTAALLLAFELVADALVLPLPSLVPALRRCSRCCLPRQAGGRAVSAARPRCAIVAAVVFAVAALAVDRALGADRRLGHRHPALRDVRRADRRRRTCPTATSASSTRRGRCPPLVLPALVTGRPRRYDSAFAALMALVRRGRRAARRGVAATRSGASRRRRGASRSTCRRLSRRCCSARAC